MRRLLALIGTVLALVLAGASVAGAAELSGGCSGSGVSTDEDGDPLDEVSAPGPGGTSSDPFLVDADGGVAWEGSTGVAFHDHRWDVKVMGAEVKSDGDENEGDEVEAQGVEEVSDYLPFDAVGLYRVSGSISADEGSCDGSAWIKVVGSPVGTPLWILGIVATVAGAALLAGPTIGMFGRGR